MDMIKLDFDLTAIEEGCAKHDEFQRKYPEEYKNICREAVIKSHYYGGWIGCHIDPAIDQFLKDEEGT